MKSPDLQLPDDVDALKAMILAMAEKAARADVLESEIADLKARNADADEQIAKLKQVLKAFDRFRYGRRSEKQGRSADTISPNRVHSCSRKSRPALPRSKRWWRSGEAQRLQNVHHVPAKTFHLIWNASMWGSSRRSFLNMPARKRS